MIDLWSEDETTTVRLWSLTEDAFVEDGRDAASYVVLNRWGELEVKGVDPAAAEFLRRMGFGPVSLRNVLPDATDDGGARSAAAAALGRMLDQIGCVIVHSLGLPDGKGALLSVVPMVAEPTFEPRPMPPGRSVRLSRFATMRPVAGRLVLEAPGAPFHVQLNLPGAQAVAAGLSSATTVEQLSATTGIPIPVVGGLVSFLVAAGVVLLADEDGSITDDTDPVALGWSHHEMLFHEHSSRRGGAMPSDALIDRAARAPSPVTRSDRPGRRIPLPRVDVGALATADATLTTLLELDHTCPRPAGGELSLQRVGQLLYRSARVRSTGPAQVPMRGGISYEASQRPYFSIACLYELELYLTVNRCAGLPRGIYHYDPLGHALIMVDDHRGRGEELLDRAKVGAGSTRHPAATVTVTARMPRTTWVLAGMSYAVALMHSGALLETLYLVGRAVGIAAHVVVADGNRTADELLGLAWPAEVALSECLLDPEE